MIAAAHHNPAAASAGACHHQHVVALRAADDVQQPDLSGQARPHARRVIAALWLVFGVDRLTALSLSSRDVHIASSECLAGAASKDTSRSLECASTNMGPARRPGLGGRQYS